MVRYCSYILFIQFLFVNLTSDHVAELTSFSILSIDSFCRRLHHMKIMTLWVARSSSRILVLMVHILVLFLSLIGMFQIFSHKA